MACRDCKFWIDRGMTGFCDWPDKPPWLAKRFYDNETAPTDGEGCPQFKEREDGTS